MKNRKVLAQLLNIIIILRKIERRDSSYCYCEYYEPIRNDENEK